MSSKNGNLSVNSGFGSSLNCGIRIIPSQFIYRFSNWEIFLLTIPRSFGIYLPSIFALILISVLIEKAFNGFDLSSKQLQLIGKSLSILILIIGITGGIYRSNMQIESVNKFSNSIIQYDARMLYHKKHLENLNVYEYNWKKTYSGIVSPKIINNKYHPLRF